MIPKNLNLNNFTVTRDPVGYQVIKASSVENYWILKWALLEQGFKVQCGEGHSTFLYKDKEFVELCY